MNTSRVEKSIPTIRFDHEVSLTIDGENIPLKKDEVINLTVDKPIFAESKGRVSMLVYPVNSSESELKITLPHLDSSKITETQDKVGNQKLDKILHEVQLVQILMLKQDYVTALTKIRELKNAHPGIAFLSFIEGSCYSVMNQNNEAIRSIREGLEIYPHSADAKELYKRLSGKEY